MATRADSGDEGPSTGADSADMDCGTLSRSFRKMDQKFNLLIQALGFDLEDDDACSVNVDTPKDKNEEEGEGRTYSLRGHSTPEQGGGCAYLVRGHSTPRDTANTDEEGTSSSAGYQPIKTNSLDGFFKDTDNHDKGGDDIHPQVADWVSSHAKGLDGNTLKTLQEEHKMPQNVNLFVPPLDKFTFDKLPKATQTQEIKLQHSQKMFQTGMVPVLKSCSDVAAAVEKGEGLTADDTNKLLRQLIDSVSLLTHANFDYLMLRRRLLKPNLDPKFAPLCDSDIPVGATLFGDDLQERAKKLTEIETVNIVKTPDKASSFSRFRPYTAPGSSQRGGRPFPGFNPNWQQNLRKLPFLGRGGYRGRPNPDRAPARGVPPRRPLDNKGAGRGR